MCVCVCLVFFVLCWWCCYLNWYLIVSWFMISTGSMLVLLGNVTSTGNFINFSGGCMFFQQTCDMIIYLWYRCTSIQHPVLECQIIIFERYSSMSMSFHCVYKLYAFNKFGNIILIPNSWVVFHHLWIQWLYWTWSVQWTVFCYDVGNLLCASYIKADNAWAGKIWMSYRRGNTQYRIKIENTSVICS